MLIHLYSRFLMMRFESGEQGSSSEATKRRAAWLLFLGLGPWAFVRHLWPRKKGWILS